METLINATNEYLQSQIDELKAQLSTHSNCDYWKKENGRIQSQIIDVVNAFYDFETPNFEIIKDLCEIIDYSPTKEINFTATINFTGTIQIPAAEAEDFDLTAALEDAYVDINHGDVVIDGYELYDANEC